MTLQKTIFDQVKEIDKLKESLLGNSYLKTIEQYKNQELLREKLSQAKEIDNIKQSLFANSASKILEEVKNQEIQRQKFMKNSFSIPDSALQTINALNARNRLYADSISSQVKKIAEEYKYRPPKFIDSIFESATSKLFKELSRSPLTQFNKLTYPENLVDLMLGKNIQDFEIKYKDSLKLFPSEISSALAISKMLGPVGIHAHYEEIVKELKRQENEHSSDDKRELFSREFVISVFLAALMFLYQEYSSSQMEQRLNSKIDAKAQEAMVQSSQEQKERIDQLELLIVNLSQTQQKPFASVEYVVKDRSALIREEPKNGSKVIAHIFPNQVIAIIDSEGKWIEVTYYDWAKRNSMNGWVLKKYLERIKSK